MDGLHMRLRFFGRGRGRESTKHQAAILVMSKSLKHRSEVRHWYDLY